MKPITFPCRSAKKEIRPARLLLLFFFLLFCGSPLSAQQSKSLAFELGGSGGIASINWESSFRNTEALALLWRVGFSFAPVDPNNGTALVFPLMIHGVFGKSKHRLDLGLGQSVSITTKGNFFLRAPLSLGYRLQPEDKKYYLRLAYTPIISYLLDFQWQHWAGFTFAYRLK